MNTELTDGRIRDNTNVKRCGLNISYKKLPTTAVEWFRFQESWPIVSIMGQIDPSDE